MEKIIKTAILLIEDPAKINPKGETREECIDLLDNETLAEAQKRYQKEHWPIEYKWKTVKFEDGSYKRELYAANLHKIPLVCGAYPGKDRVEIIPDEPKITLKAVKPKPEIYKQITIDDLLRG